MKRKVKDLTKSEYMVTLDSLYTAASSLTGREAVKAFLRDLLTPSERVMLGRRVVIARLLLAGETYERICERVRVGKGTVSRVDKWLNDQFPGYEKAIQGLEREMQKRKAGHPESYTYAWLKKKYPLHFLLFPRPKPQKTSRSDMYPG